MNPGDALQEFFRRRSEILNARKVEREMDLDMMRAEQGPQGDAYDAYEDSSEQRSANRPMLTPAQVAKGGNYSEGS